MKLLSEQKTMYPYMMNHPQTVYTALLSHPILARIWRFVFAIPVLALLTPIMTTSVSAQSVDSATLGDLQLRIIAIENTLRDVNARVENDLFELKQSMESGDNTNAVLERVDQKLNDISNISNEISSLNLKIQNILQIASDNEFRILQLEARIKTLMRLSSAGAIIPSDQLATNTDNLDIANAPDVAPTVSNSPTTAGTDLTATPDTNGTTLSGADNALDAGANANTSSDTAWIISKSDLDAGTTAVSDPAPTNLTVTEPEPKVPAILPDGTEEEQYNFAKDLLHNNRLKEAELALIEFSELHEESELSADVKFWIGRVQFVQGEHQKSLQTMSDFLKTWPEDPRKIEVLMWIAESVSKTRPKEDACNFFEKLILTVENPPEKLTNRLARLGEKTECEA
jgi:TolA-binding protein